MNENINTMSGGGDVYELDELLGVYALDAVSDDERRRVEDYLQINPRAAAEVADHRGVAAMLAFTGMDAPDDVWTRIAADIDGDLAPPVVGPELAKVFTLDISAAHPESAPADEATTASVTPLRRGRTQWLLGAAAAVALLVAGAAVVTADRTSSDPLNDAFAAAQSADSSLNAELVTDGSDARAFGVIAANGQGFLDGGELPRLDESMTYQLWGVLADTGDVVSIGILGNEPGLQAFTVDGDVTAMAVTIEEAPGVISDGNGDGAYVGSLV